MPFPGKPKCGGLCTPPPPDKPLVPSGHPRNQLSQISRKPLQLPFPVRLRAGYARFSPAAKPTEIRPGTMKEYRLLAWPELTSEFQRTAHRRVLSDLSLRYMSSAQLIEVSGLKKGELKVFLSMLDARGLLDERDGTAPDSFLDSIGKLGWFRRPGSSTHDGR